MNQSIIKLFHLEFQPFICQECKKQINLPKREIRRLCLLSYKELKKEKFKGLCPECTKKWLQKQPHIRGQKAVIWFEEAAL